MYPGTINANICCLFSVVFFGPWTRSCTRALASSSVIFFAGDLPFPFSSLSDLSRTPPVVDFIGDSAWCSSWKYCSNLFQ